MEPRLSGSMEVTVAMTLPTVVFSGTVNSEGEVN